VSPRRSRGVVITVAILYAAICWVLTPPGPFTAPDSVAYLEMQPIVPLGYPLLLRAFGADAATRWQPLIFAAALAVLGIETLALTASLPVALIVQLGIIATPGLRDFHASILTESLFMSGLVAFLAAMTAFVRAPSDERAAVAGIIAGLTACVRRTAYAFVPVLVLMVWIERRRLRSMRRTLTAAIVPAVAVLALEGMVARAIHGDARSSLMGRHLFAKAALLPGEASGHPLDDSRRRLHEALQVTYAPIRALIAEARGNIRPSLTLFYETCLQGPCVAELRTALGSMTEKAKDDVFAEAALVRIRETPVEFVRLWAAHYRSLWTANKLQHPGTATALTAFLAARRPVPFEREAFKVGPGEAIEFRPSPLVSLLQPVVILIGVFTAAVAVIGLVAAAYRRAGTVLSVAALAAATAHGCLMFSALAAAGISRFLMGVLPAVVMAACLAAWICAAPLARYVATLIRARYQ
jgi:hypothetical protein